MTHLKKIVLAVPFLACLSCEKVIEPKNLPEQDARLVLNSIVSSGANFTASLSVSKSIVSGKDYKFVDNGVCEVYENDVYVTTLVSLGKGNYGSSFLPKPNNKYTLKVAANGYEGVKASTTMPPDITAPVVTWYDTTTKYYKQSQSNYSYIGGSSRYKFTIIDNPSVKNFYSVSATAILYDENDAVITASISPYINSNSNSSISSGQISYGNSLDLDDAQLVNGKEIPVNINVDISVTNIDDISKVKRMEVYLNLYSYSEDYSKYKQTLYKQATTRGSLFAEPALVYSNVSNEMGIFAGSSAIIIPVYNRPLRSQ